MQTFDTTTPVTAILTIPAGRVRVVAADRAAISVDVQPADATKSRDVRAAEQTTVVYGDGVLRVEAPAKNQYFTSPGSLDVTVELPSGSRIEGKSGAAELRAVGPLGDVAFDGAHGAVELDETASLRLTVHAGDVSVGRLAGDSEITVAKGDIRIAEAVHGKVTLRTEAGTIDVGAARGASATLDAGTTYGRIDNALSNTVGPAAELSIHATTSYGDITARSL
ncbi:DUF4097 family beta strand repeat-containing protein [Streptomyces sp. NPDC006530]|uniref:DUF4097 family beta strand repeat-containing protein n=1 Tax=Streptomyces sp. NPDC006530 TaxID=3364750 RepID=UPI0036B5FD3A